MPGPISILFLCTGNSARSIMAEAIANHLHGDALRAVSAGSQPKGEPHPLALETLRRHDVPTEGCRSKSWDEFRDHAFDVVITLCGSAARETCPTFPGAPARAHWGFPDPPGSANPEATFEEVFTALAGAIRHFAASEEPDPARRAAETARLVAELFPGVA